MSKKIKLSIFSTPEVRRGLDDDSIDQAGPSFVPETPQIDDSILNHANIDTDSEPQSSPINQSINQSWSIGS